MQHGVAVLYALDLSVWQVVMQFCVGFFTCEQNAKQEYVALWCGISCEWWAARMLLQS